MLSKKLEIITHYASLQRVRKIPTQNTNPRTTIQPVISILTTTTLQVGSGVNASC